MNKENELYKEIIDKTKDEFAKEYLFRKLRYIDKELSKDPLSDMTYEEMLEESL